MLKFQRNRTKPKLITILSVISRYILSQQRPRRSPIATEKHEQNIALRFGQKNPELQPESNLVPRASFPLTSGRKTRALGASVLK